MLVCYEQSYSLHSPVESHTQQKKEKDKNIKEGQPVVHFAFLCKFKGRVKFVKTIVLSCIMLSITLPELKNGRKIKSENKGKRSIYGNGKEGATVSTRT